jgi:hypothetical protein
MTAAIAQKSKAPMDPIEMEMAIFEDEKYENKRD